MSSEDIILSIESTPGTWVTPATGFPLTKATHKLGRSYIQKRYTGKGRELIKDLLGGIMPSGSFEVDVWPESMGMFFQAAGFDATTTTPAGATNAREHGFLVGTDADLGSLSAQIKRSASIAHNILRLSIDKVTLKAVGGSEATLAFDWLAKDESIAGGTWNYDGSASPAVVAAPTYIGATLTPFIFYDAVLTLGGTPALDATSKEITLGSGSTIAYVENLEISIQNGMKQFHTLQGDPTPYAFPAEDLEISVKMDIDQNTLSTLYYGYAQAGTTAGLQITFTGAEIDAGVNNYKFQVTLPELSFNVADMPDIEGSSKRRTQTIEAVAVKEATIDHAIGITLIDQQTAY